MLLTTIARVEEEQMPRLRSWLASLASRRGELRESYKLQGTRHEQFFLIRTRGLPVLVLISEVDDVDRATSSFLRSNLPIDVEFKSLVQEISPGEVDLELLYDSATYLDVTAE